MRKYLQFRHRAVHCAICDANFGLIRHYSWRTALCSKKCVGRLKSRKEADRSWFLPIFTARHQLSAGMIRSRKEEAA
jgi:hypothetical protein